jgi:RNA polymerase sigma factor (sigma-70 family)
MGRLCGSSFFRLAEIVRIADSAVAMLTWFTDGGRRHADKGKHISQTQHLAKDGLKAILMVNRPSLLRFLAARRVSPDDAEDLLQDLFVKLESQAIGPIAEPRAYLYRMVDNLLLDRRRAWARRASREDAWMAAQTGTAVNVDDRPSAEQALIARERLAMISKALGELPERTVLIFRKFRLEGIPQKQIAAELGITISAVEKHLQKAYRVVTGHQALVDADMAPSRRQ